MLSKNNFNERLRKMEPRKERYSIRKFSVGAASVLIGFFLMGMNQTQTVKAATPSTKTSSVKAPTAPAAKDSETANTNNDKQTATPAEKPAESAKDSSIKVTLNGKREGNHAGMTAAGDATGAQSNATATLKDSKVVAERFSNGSKSGDKISTDRAALAKATLAAPKKSDAGAAGKKGAAKDSKTAKTVKTEKAAKATENKVTLDSVTKEAADLAKQIQEGKISQEDAAAKLQADIGKLPLVDQVKLRDQILPTITHTRGITAVSVSDWQGFVNALNNTDVGTITLDHDIDVTNNVNGITRPHAVANSGELNLTGSDISGAVVIEGNGKSINFGSNYLSFDTNNQKNSDPWDITFKDLIINANGYDSGTYAGAFSPFYMGGDDIQPAALLAKNKVTFDSVVANIQHGGFFVTTMPQLAGDDPYTTVTFKGLNFITCNDLSPHQLISSPYNYASAVMAAHIVFANGTNTIFKVKTTKTNNDTNAGGNILRAKVEDSNDTDPAIDIQQGATVELDGQSRDVKGILTNNAITGTVQVDGTLNANMADGHSVAIMAGNLNIGKNGAVNIVTAQNNDGGPTNADSTYNGFHYAPISLGVGFAQSNTNADSNTLNDYGKLTIKRTSASSTSPLISFGSAAPSLVKGTFTLNVGDGATLDLQDAAQSTRNGKITNTPFAGLITMWGGGTGGTSTSNTINVTNPAYFNLQRTGAQTGSLIRLENINNHVNIQSKDANSSFPLAQWDEGSTGNGPSFYWYINGLKTQNNWGDHSIAGFAGQGKADGSATTEGIKFLHSNGTVTLRQGGLNEYQYQDGTTASNSGVKYYTPNLNQFLNHFSWWAPQRIAMGTKLEDNGVTPSDAQKYQPEVKTINGTTSQKLDDSQTGELHSKDGIKDLITSDGSTISLPSNATVTWYNSRSDQAQWNAQMKDAAGNAMAEPTNPNGNLQTTDTSAWAKVTYHDGTVDFVKIPLHITDPTASLADQYTPTGGTISVLEGHTLDSTDAENAIINKDQLEDSTGHSVVDNYAWKTAPDTSVPGSKSGVVTVTYTDGTHDDVPVTVNVETQADHYNPQSKDITTPQGTLPDASEGIANKTDLPSGTTYTWSEAPDVSKPGDVQGVVKVTYPDSTVDTVPVNVHVGTPGTSTTKTDAEKNNPQGKKLTTTIGNVPAASDAIANQSDLPAGTTYEWSQEPNVYSKGDHPAVVKVTYPDHSVDYVSTTVTVTNEPTGKYITTPKGTVPTASSAIDWGTGTEPADTTITWVTEPDVSQAGDTRGTAKIVYKDGETTTVIVPIHVTDPSTATSFDPYGTTIRVPYGHTLTGEDAKRAIVANSIPSGATDVTYAWKVTPPTSNTPTNIVSNTTQQGYVTVSATIGGRHVSKDVIVYVRIGDQAENYDPQGQNLTVTKGDPAPTAKSAITNTADLPSDAQYEWAYTVDTNVVGTQSNLVKVTYPDGSFDYVPVNITVKDKALDADKYQPEYAEKTISAGGNLTDDKPTWSTADSNQGDPADHNSSAKFALVTTGSNAAPSWASIDENTGEIKGTNVPAGNYVIPVQVTYKDKSTETVYAPVTVTGTKHDDDTVWVYGNNTTRSFSINTFDTHKTNDGSANAMANVNAPQIGTITFSNDAYNKDTHQYKTDSSVTYTLSSDGSTYNATSAFIGGSTITNPTLAQVQQVNSSAVQSFAADQVKTRWLTAADDGYDGTPDTEASKFALKGDGRTPGSGIGTSKASVQYGDPDGDQRTASGQLAGNSRARANISLSGTAANIFGSNIGWINVFGNFYGAKSGGELAFKQNSDISNLTQAQYRQLVDVTDLGKNGWNGTNVNPNAPQVLAYVPGTDASKTFTMTWAPNGGQPSTATVADNVAGSVRIHFNDGTYLDVPVTIKVVKDDDAGKPDTDRSSFTQKIIYYYNKADGTKQEVGYTTIDNIPKNHTLYENDIWPTIQSNVPSNYQLANGYRYHGDVTNITSTPADIWVPVELKSGEETKFNAQGNLVYQTATGTLIKTGPMIKSHIGDTLTAGLLHDLADQSLPSGYTIAQYPASFEVTRDNASGGFKIPVIVRLATTDADKYTPKYNDTTVNATDPVDTGAPTFTTDGHSTTAPAGTKYAFSDGITSKTITDKNGQNPVTATINANTGAITFTAPDTATEYDVPVTVTYPDNSTDTPVIAKVFVNKTFDPTKVTPTDPTYKDMFKTVTRKIITTKPDGTSSTATQSLDFGRTMTIHGDGTPNTFGNWQAGQLNGNHFTIPADPATEFAAQDITPITGYTSYYKIGANGTPVAGTQVPAASALDENGVPTDGTTVYVTYRSNGGGDVTPPTPTQGEVIIKYVKKGTTGPVIKTVTLPGNEGSTIPVAAAIKGNVPAGWLLDPDYIVPADSIVSNTIVVPVIADNGGNNPGNDDHHNTNPGDNGDHNNPGNNNHNNNNGNNGNRGNNGAANGNHNGAINGNGGRGAALNNGNGAANGNQARKAALPQTGANKTSELGLIGLAIASIGSLLGLGVNKKRRN